ncbi:TetR/AcrR family transcriptional regulator [Mycobacterium sp. MYCO198283]|uniref:TetR/AcrR family transcriptional regulator n=1 Tax=Mycobacterium sp. MYCO198283 TaxID=2883505 RepID=UPI001E410736|nr:TetR/AcrR family transcriptional regulator [Mycobacterium sp. MYCO198283]MCG5432514.1 TetR/AcrR family transcriptional regulator [Mycobacterium sp. MYCO198283]
MTSPRTSNTRDRLLAAAEDAFGAEGVGASLAHIAKAAGVGVRTLQSHFPTRDDLIAALVVARLDAVVTRGRELAGGPPRAGLIEWLGVFVSGASAYRGLPESVIRTLDEPGSPLYPACRSVLDTCRELLGDAQRAGAVRADIDATDLLTLAAGVAATTTQRGEHAQRLLGVVVDGITIGPVSTPAAASPA